MKMMITMSGKERLAAAGTGPEWGRERQVLAGAGEGPKSRSSGVEDDDEHDGDLLDLVHQGAAVSGGGLLIIITNCLFNDSSSSM